MKKKVILLLLVLCVLICVGLIFLLKGNKTDEKLNAEKLMERYEPLIVLRYHVPEDYFGYLVRYDSLNASQIPVDAKIFLACNNAVSFDGKLLTLNDDNFVTNIPRSAVKKQMYLAFNDDSYKDQSTKPIYSSTGVNEGYLYSNDKKNYSNVVPNIAVSFDGNSIYTKIVDSVLTADGLDVYLKVAFLTYEQTNDEALALNWSKNSGYIKNIKVYADYEKNIFIGDSKSENIYKKFSDKLSTFVFSFKKNDNNYYLYSVKKR